MYKWFFRFFWAIVFVSCPFVWTVAANTILYDFWEVDKFGQNFNGMATWLCAGSMVISGFLAIFGDLLEADCS